MQVKLKTPNEQLAEDIFERVFGGVEYVALDERRPHADIMNRLYRYWLTGAIVEVLDAKLGRRTENA